MKSSYNHIFFDLDHTLWDYDQNARVTLVELYDGYALFNYGKCMAEQLVEKFFRINSQLWWQYDLGQIDREFLRQQRFRMIFRELGFTDMDLAFQFGEDYVALCPLKSAVVPGAIELLDYLTGRYTMHVITNGFNDVQLVKIKSSGLSHYFSEVITSERAGARKPSAQIFSYSMEITGAGKHNSVMVGDNLITDIGGARASGIDHVYYNPEKVAHSEPVTLEIHTLHELKEYL